jgi:hypothetical protein
VPGRRGVSVADAGRPPGEHALFVWNRKLAAVAAAASADPGVWWDGFGALMDRIAPRFARCEPFRHAAGMVQGLMSSLERKNCWTIAEAHGATSPPGMQHPLGRAAGTPTRSATTCAAT